MAIRKSIQYRKELDRNKADKIKDCFYFEKIGRLCCWSCIRCYYNYIFEQFNSIINKVITGKQIHFSLKQTYNTRIQAAIITYYIIQNKWKFFKRISLKCYGKKSQVKKQKCVNNIIIYDYILFVTTVYEYSL